MLTVSITVNETEGTDIIGIKEAVAYLCEQWGDVIGCDVQETKINQLTLDAMLLDSRFERFWAQYPRKVSKQDAKKVFMKLKPDEQLLNTILEALKKQCASAEWSEKAYIPHPDRYLRGRRWEDEVPETSESSSPIPRREEVKRPETSYDLNLYHEQIKKPPVYKRKTEK